MHLCYTNLNWFSYSIAQSQIAVNVISSNNIYTLSNWRWRPCPCLHVSQQSIIFSTCVCLVLFTLSRYQTICIQDTMWSSLYCMVMPDLKWSHKSRKCYLISQNIMLMLKCNHLLACSSTHNCRYLLQKKTQTPPQFLIWTFVLLCVESLGHREMQKVLLAEFDTRPQGIWCGSKGSGPLEHWATLLGTDERSISHCLHSSILSNSRARNKSSHNCFNLPLAANLENIWPWLINANTLQRS